MGSKRKFFDLSSVPKKPGVYIFKGAKEKVIYVGKAKNLRNRVKSYFLKSAALDERKSAMVRGIKDFSYVVTESELEALALEANLIKQYRPTFNVILRDDKNYPYLKVTTKDQWPTIEVVRRIKRDGSLYFGPYIPAGAMWETLSFIRRHFGIRPCRYKLDKPMRPCIQYQMKRCPAPCAGLVDRDEYLKAIEDAVLFLRGKKTELIDELQMRMEALSDRMRYEEAAKLRDRVSALKSALETQKVISPGLGDMDIIGVYTEGGSASFQVFFVRAGVMTGVRDFRLGDMSAPPKELMYGFIETLYSKEIIPPDEVVVGIRPQSAETLLKWLQKKRGGKVKITVPKKGKRAELLKMASENAKLHFAGSKGKSDTMELDELKDRLGLPARPESIGAFDVSVLSGSEPVGAFVFWSGGSFKKDLYRHMKIKTVSGMDDYAMMEETVRRTLDGIGELPGLIVIDGGKGQLEAARRGAEGHEVQMAAVAKDPDRAYRPDSDAEIDLEDGRPSSFLLKRIRDEVHRFAISYHKKLRGKRFLRSPLEEIRGIGKKRRLSLLKHFGSIEKIKAAPVEEIAKAPGMNRKAAEALKEALMAGYKA